MYKWAEYYKKSKEVFGDTSTFVYDLTFRDYIDTKLNFGSEYYKLIDEIKSKLGTSFQDGSLFSHSGNALFIDDCFTFEDELSIIVENYLRDYLEKNIFGSYVHCDHVTLYKTPQSNENPQNSWLWHFDNSPLEQMKVMIYLNDVNESNGPFQILRNKNSKEGLKIDSSRIDYTNWRGKKEWSFNYKNLVWKATRIPLNFFSSFKLDGYVPYKVTGNKGHVSIFDNNIIHRGTLPSEDFRYAVVFQFKPIDKKLDKAFSRFITGNGAKHPTFDKDPAFMWDSTKPDLL